MAGHGVLERLHQRAAGDGQHVQGVAEGVDLLHVRLSDVTRRHRLSDAAAVDDGGRYLREDREEGYGGG